MQVQIANNGRECLELLAARDPADLDLILMDVEMPEMDGITAVGQIRRDPRWQHKPVIAMTAHALKGDRERLLAAGMSGYVSKPISPKNLYETLLMFV
jgi:CheY-like chemotaxis protein